ncbi:MAG: GlxA family transcriptional regulator [Dongiaceae bacterium]
MNGPDASREPARFAFVLVPRFNMMALTATIEPLRVANYLTGRRLYDWSFLSPDGGPVTASNGMIQATLALPDRVPGDSTVFVCGSWDSEHYDNPELFAWLRRQDRRGVRLGAMDIGAYILARAGLIENRRIAVLWYCVRAFLEAYPDVRAEERLFVDDGNRITIAGGTAGVDAMLADIGSRHDMRLAHEVADNILHFPIRGANEPQRSSRGGQHEIVHPTLRLAIGLMEGHVEEPLAIPAIAAKVGVSQRKLERLFINHVGRSAVAYYRTLRLQHARVLLTNTSLSIREIALACGYGSLSHFAKSFSDLFEKRPREYRNAWPHDDPDPIWLGFSPSLAPAKKR